MRDMTQLPHDTYDNPLITRYASPSMSQLWGDQRKFSTWRKLWIALAESQQELKLPITEVQLEQMRAHVDDIDFDAAKKYEQQLRHDVMAHVHTFADACPEAGPIIHWGATSCFVTDNTDLILLREALQLIRRRLMTVLRHLATFAQEHRDLACLGFTHMQPAQPTTMGKRACLWAYDIVQDLGEIEFRLQTLRARSTKGTTGTQASFLNLFDGDHEKVRQLECLVAEKLGFTETYAVTGQTYPRKVDSQILDTLSGIGQSAHKAASDLRLLAHRKEVEEPFGKKQIGSSAMAYKRNPMRCERMCALARFAITLASNAAQTLSTQWMERTLDDSANRRLVIPQAFLAIDAILILYANVAEGMVVYPKVIAKHLQEELPFMATEEILMAAVMAGGDRQELHEQIRQHSQQAAAAVKQQGQSNDLLERLRNDASFANVDLDVVADPARFVGRAPQQVNEFLAEVITPILEEHGTEDDLDGTVSV
ncbi:MAG: adenylosuccinate lyase [Pirellulaceae bacterium]|nr:adenylosuccinate lyase [Pirellulaceae bacterium]